MTFLHLTRSWLFLLSSGFVVFAGAQGQVRVVRQPASECGAAWTLSLSPGGSVQTQQEVSDEVGGLSGLEPFGAFGSAACSLGDLDLDGLEDVAVGARTAALDGTGRGAVWILFLNADRTVKSRMQIGSGSGGFTGELENGDQFGCSLAAVGDLDGNGISELAVGASASNAQEGAVWILFLRRNGTVASQVRVAAGSGGFGALDDGDRLGAGMAALGDLDQDGVEDLGVGAPGDDDLSVETGAVWILFLNSDGSVKATQKISRTSGGFNPTGLTSFDHFGSSLGAGDVDLDGVTDIAVGSPDDTGGINEGSLWILFLNSNGTVRSWQKIGVNAGGFVGPLAPSASLGGSVGVLDDLDGDGTVDVAAGAPGMSEVFVLFLNPNGTVRSEHAISAEVAGLEAGDRFGSSIASLGDLDGNGVADVAIGAEDRDGAGGDHDTIQDAVDGDVILVKSGSYGRMLIAGKALTVQAESGALVQMSPSSLRRPVPASRSAKVRRSMPTDARWRGAKGAISMAALAGASPAPAPPPHICWTATISCSSLVQARPVDAGGAP